MLLFRIFLPFACGYYLSYLFRSINAVIYPALEQDLGVTTGAMGVLTSAYLVVFAAVQVPLGLALDRYGPRRVDAVLLLVAAGGALAFSYATRIEHLVMARAAIGLGVSAALMASMKSFRMWFAPHQLAGLNGWFLGAGGLGAISATAPVEAALDALGWRAVFQVLAAATLAVAMIVYFIVPERVVARSSETWPELLAGLRAVARSRGFLRIGPLAATSLGPSVALQGLWVAPWLRDNLGADRAVIGSALFWMALSLALGFVFFGVASERMRRFGWSPIVVIGVATAVSTLCLGLLAAGLKSMAVVLWVIYFFTVSSVTIAYAVLAKDFPPDAAGRVNTLFNFSTFAAAFVVQFGFGWLLQLWPSVGGRPPPAAYATLLALLAVAQGIALWWLWLGGRNVPASHSGNSAKSAND